MHFAYCTVMWLLVLHSAALATNLSGVARDPEHRVMAGVVILITTGDRTEARTATDGQGKYRISSLPPGRYHLTGTKAGYQPSSAEVVVSADDEQNVDLTLPPAPFDFADEPQFTVAGVSDAAAGGGHGSATTVHATDRLTRDAASLAHSPQSNNPEQLRQKALSLLAANANDDAAHRMLAEANEQSGRFVEAESEYRRAAQLSPSEGNLFNWASELLTHRSYGPAAEIFQKGVASFPESTRMQLGLAVSLYAGGEYASSARAFYRACDLNPKEPEPYLFLARAQNDEITKSTQYAKYMKRFAQLNPEDARAQYLYAMTLDQQPDNQSQRDQLLQAAVRLDPQLAEAHLELGIAAEKRGDLSSAVEAYEQAIHAAEHMQDPTSTALATAHYRLAEVYKRQEKTGLASQQFEAYRKISRQAATAAEKEREQTKEFVTELKKKQPGH